MNQRVSTAFIESLMTTSFDSRVLEPESMEETAEDYAGMDFAESNSAFVREMSPLIPEGSLVADFGCGPGDIPLLLARERPDLTIVGVDLSPSMLEMAARRADAAGLVDRLRWTRGDITRPVFEPGELDFAYSHTTLHHLPELRPCFVQLARALRPGGGYYIRDLRRPASARQAAEWIREATGDELTQRQYELFFHSLRASLTPEEAERELAGTGLDGRVEVPAAPSRYWVLSGAVRHDQ